MRQRKSSLRGSSIASDDQMEDQTVPSDGIQKMRSIYTHQLSLDKKKKVKNQAEQENHTGLRKQPAQQGKGFAFGNHQEGPETNRMHTNRLQLEAANSISGYFHPFLHSYHQDQSEAPVFGDTELNSRQHSGGLDHLNRPSKINPHYEQSHVFRDNPEPSWLTNRQIQNWPYRFHALKNGKDDQEVETYFSVIVVASVAGLCKS